MTLTRILSLFILVCVEEAIFTRRIPLSSLRCNPDEFACRNNVGDSVCMPNIFKCDEKIDCLEYADEKNCDERSITCAEDEFRCEHRKMCIHRKFRCDGNLGDCSDMSDEKGCPNNCDPRTKQICKDGKLCIDKAVLCDGIPDCTNGLDEFNCSRNKRGYGKGTKLQCSEEMFKCLNGLQCIPESFVCDGSNDCDDSSDEFNCGRAWTCKPNSKICANGICRPESDFCNGVEDCSDGSDESNCPPEFLSSLTDGCRESEYKCDFKPKICIQLNRLCRTAAAVDDCPLESACRTDLKLCNQKDPNCKCRRTYTNTTVCYCPDGFKKINGKCEDVDECQTIGMCDQICNNLLGTFNCSCYSGYQLYAAKGYGTARKCRVLGERPLLIISNRIETRQFDLVSRRYYPLVSNLSSDVVIDFWYANSTLMWSDSSKSQLVSCQAFRMDNGMLNNLRDCVEKGSLDDDVANKSSQFHGIAIDWIHGLAFWTEVIPSPAIKVYDFINPNKYFRVIIDDDVDQPKSIVVDPSAGLIFWADLTSDARIERAGMNGGNRMAILKSPKLKWPTALTIDVLERRLYWADAKLKSILSSDYYGHNIRIILHSYYIVRNPFSMIVFEDRIFLSDRDHDNIMSINRFDGSDLEILFTRLQGPTALRVYHKQLQPQQRNLCANHTCSQLCLPMTSMRENSPDKESSSDLLTSFMCMCTDGHESDPSDPNKCHKQSLDDYYTSDSRKRRHRSIFSTLATLVMIMMVIGAVYYWFANRGPRYTNSFQQFENPAFEST